MDSAQPTARRLLAAALELVKEDGIQAVTHRTVEERAGVARGSTRYHFGSRDALLAALVGHVAEVDLATTLGSMAAEGLHLEEMTPEQQNAAISRITRAMLADPLQSLARFELYLYAARRPELGDVVSRWREAFVAVGAPHLTAAGAIDGEASARLLAAAMDGLLLHALSAPHPDYAQWGEEWTGLLGVASTALGRGARPQPPTDSSAEPVEGPSPDASGDRAG